VAWRPSAQSAYPCHPRLVPGYNGCVNYREGIEALQKGDFESAADLLAKAAEQTEYASDVINHSYTLALYRLGDKSRLADVAFRVAKIVLPDDEASAMDYFQRAMFAGLDRPRVRQIGEVYERWALESYKTTLDRPVRRVAHIIGCLSPGHASTEYIKLLTASLRRQGIESTVFTTEWASSWFFNPADIPQSVSVEIEGTTRIASVEGNFVERAQRIADAIRTSGIQVAFFHAGLSEQITARVAAFRPVPLQINVNHGNEMDADLFRGFVHLYHNAMQRTGFPSHPADWIPSASDVETRLRTDLPATRQSLGLESTSTISATFGNLDELSKGGYARVLAEILKRFPKHFHIFAGPGNIRTLRSTLHHDGVLPQVRFLGHISDVAPLFEAVDIYLAPFPDSGGQTVLEAMGAGKPVIVMRFPADSPYNSGSELVGVRELVAATEADYAEIADRLLRNPSFREQQSSAMRARFHSEFHPDRLGERYAAFLERLTSS
jgi:hypothetical protein